MKKSDREEWLQDETAHGYQVRLRFPRDYVLSGSIFSSIFILALSLLFIVILYVTLKKTFSKYQTQVVDLVETIMILRKGSREKRIDLTKKDQELLFNR